MRALAIGNMYPPHHLGGYELAWRGAMRHLREQGHEVRVLTTDAQTDTDERDDPDTYRELRWYWMDHAWPRISWPARVRLERHNQAVLDRHLNEFDPDVVSWWAMGGMSLSMIERVRRAGIPAVAFVHDDWLTYGPRVDRWTRAFAGRPRAARIAERLTAVPAGVELSTAARYVFVSRATRDRARSAGVAASDGEIAHSGIDASFLDPRPPHPWAWRLLYVGRIDERKGVGDAIEALAALPPGATLAIAGAGDAELVEQLKRLAERHGVAERIRWLGMRSRGELPAIYEAADVVLFPVRWEEPWGLVPLEAMGLGRPVIATGQGGSGEYLRDGENALLVPPGDPAAMAAAASRLAEDPELLERLRSGGLETARRHTETEFNRAVLDALALACRHR
jgi:glycogen(starch) synthase